MHSFFIFSLLLLSSILSAQSPRETVDFDSGWRFAYGDASDMYKDYTHGTEYFTYLTKAAATGGNMGPAGTKFDDIGWQEVTLPHDWVVDLPYSGEASHSHGYKMVGAKYPQNSIGWYRKHFSISQEDKGKRIYIRFDGIFRDAQVFCNGFYLGHEPSGYATQVYDITEYLDYGSGDNIITVRADASTEEGWFYEGAGIYRHTWLEKTSQVHIPQFGTYVTTDIRDIREGIASGPDVRQETATAALHFAVKVRNDGLTAAQFQVRTHLLDAQGNEIACTGIATSRLLAKEQSEISQEIPPIEGITLWNLENPYLYTLRTDVFLCSGNTTEDNGNIAPVSTLVDTYTTSFGFRTIEFNPQRGFLLNGHEVKLKGTNLHQDHSGVGAAIPDGLWEYRIAQLKKIGSNAIRTSHNPVSPAVLDLCDRMGMLVIEENRLIGINEAHIDLLRRMIERDRNHPCIILWSIGNEEWAVEGSEKGRMIAESMTEYVHRFDPTRLTSYGCSGGRVLLYGVDVKGYNYIVQNDVEGFHERYPDWCAIGSEETSGCGTRGVYHTDPEKGWMLSHNRAGVTLSQAEKEALAAATEASDDQTASTQGPILSNIANGRSYNVIERGWRFYDERPWLGGLFYWTGLDYRGEPNPMSFPATGSQFGILDYCGFPKDEAFYLKSWWTSEPVLYIAPNWNGLDKNPGDSVKVFVYSNCDEVELFVKRKSLGRRTMIHDGHLEWDAIYAPGSISARGYRGGKRVMNTVLETTGEAASVVISTYTPRFGDADCSPDVLIYDLTLVDAKGRPVPDAMNSITVSVDAPATILGWGNGDPGFKAIERPAPNSDPHTITIQAFCGNAQVLVTGGTGALDVDLRR